MFFFGSFALCALAACNQSPPARTSELLHPLPPGWEVPNFVTPDGSGETVHPDFAQTPQGWPVGPWLLALTPYPSTDNRYENPSLYQSADGEHWREVGTNPVVLPGPGFYLSDPDMLFNPDAGADGRGELWLYYRRVRAGKPPVGEIPENELFLVRTANGTVWSRPERLIHVPNHRLISPSIVRRGNGDWLMWSVSAESCSGAATTVELRHSTDGRNWGAPQPVSIGFGGLSPWHLEVQRLQLPEGPKYWAMYSAKSPGSCTPAVVFLATSDDGINWETQTSPIWRRGEIDQFADVVYRSTFRYDSATDSVFIWHSGARIRYRPTESFLDWRTAFQRFGRQTLLALTARGPFVPPAPSRVASLNDSIFP